MTAEKTTMAFGWRVYGLGVMALGMVCLAWRDFVLGQEMPKDFPGRTALAYAAGAFMLVAGAAVEWRRTAAGLIVYASTARIDAVLAARLTRLGQLAFGVCALLFGGAHFVYMNLTAPLVPKWLPPTQAFWGYATGVGFIAAGVAILTGVQARLAAILLTAMSSICLQMGRERVVIVADNPDFKCRHCYPPCRCMTVNCHPSRTYAFSVIPLKNLTSFGDIQAPSMAVSYRYETMIAHPCIFLANEPHEFA